MLLAMVAAMLDGSSDGGGGRGALIGGHLWVLIGESLVRSDDGDGNQGPNTTSI